MLRTLGNLTLVLCMICRVASAGEADKPTRATVDRAQRASGPAAEAAADNMVKVEMIIAEVRHGEATLFDGQSPVAAKDRIQQLDKAGKLDSLTRVQLTTLNGQKAFFQVGQRVPQITGTSRSPAGQYNSVTFTNVGMIFEVTPQIRRDGQVFMAIDIERSQLGPADEGTPIFIGSGRSDDQPLRPARGARGGAFDPTVPRSSDAPLRQPARDAERGSPITKPSDGETIRHVPTESLTTRTSIIARSGQSVVVGAEQTRRQARQGELLIIVTPELLGDDTGPANPPARRKR
jgi:Flp pilus assembly secretin CpaC